MAWLFPNSLSSDSMDKYNHKWMVLLLLLLSLVSFIIPLAHPSTSFDNNDETKNKEIKVVCWTPEQFTLAYIAYSNAYCTKALNAALKGNTSMGKSVYELDFDSDIPPLRPENLNDAKSINESSHFRKLKEREVVKSCLQKLVTYQIPITLFVFSMCLVLPHVIWSFLSEIFSTFNVAQTLTLAEHVSTLDASSQLKIYENLSLSFASIVRSSSKSASVLYLIKKILSVVTVLALLLVICLHVQPEVEELNKALDQTSSTHPEQRTSLDGVPDEFICEFKIRQLQNFQHWTLQCTTIMDDDVGDKSQATTNSPVDENERNLLQFEFLVLKVVTAFFIILLVGNILSFCAWLCKLVTNSARQSIGLSSSTAMDIVFLAQMAHINTSVDVPYKLARSCGECDKKDFIEMREQFKT